MAGSGKNVPIVAVVFFYSLHIIVTETKPNHAGKLGRKTKGLEQIAGLLFVNDGQPGFCLLQNRQGRKQFPA